MSLSVVDLEKYFNSIDLAGKPIRLSDAELIVDREKFVRTHIQVLKSNPGNKTFMPYYERLLKFYHLIAFQ